ncbi:MAG TPA: hypothetical protein VJ112_02680 [Rhabdochlamydiaceae bacterium]|nr:hypothetical protein [Rhabdochlamydiaceae bacterium]
MKNALVELNKTTEAKVLFQIARDHFGNMQRSWYFFAKSIYLIKKNKSFEGEFESFKEFCEKEYPSIDLKILYKFVSIVEGWADVIEARLEKDIEYRLPAYESFYQLSVHRKKLPKEELSRLKKAVLDSKLGYLALRAKLKEYLEKHRKKIKKEVESDGAADVESEFLKDIKTDIDDEDPELDDDTEVIVSTKSISEATDRVEWLKNILPELKNQVDATNDVPDEVVEFAKELESLSELIEDFLKTVEDK